MVEKGKDLVCMIFVTHLQFMFCKSGSKEDADPTAMLPILSTYMGHKTVRSTAQYLRLTAEVYPDLMKKVEKSCAYVIPEVCHEGN